MNYSFNARIGEYEVLESSFIHAHVDQEITINVKNNDDGDEFKLIVIFSSSKNNNKAEQVAEGNVLRMTLSAKDHAQTIFPHPVLVATMNDGNDIFLNMQTAPVTSTIIMIYYSFLKKI